MRILVGAIATALLFPLWYAIVGGDIPLFRGVILGMPAGVFFVLLIMAALVGLCWAAMKLVASDSADEGPDAARRS